jgi:hypothetical protein
MNNLRKKIGRIWKTIIRDRIREGLRRAAKKQKLTAKAIPATLNATAPRSMGIAYNHPLTFSDYLKIIMHGNKGKNTRSAGKQIRKKGYETGWKISDEAQTLGREGWREQEIAHHLKGHWAPVVAQSSEFRNSV